MTKVDVNSKIEEQLSSHGVLLYMKGTPDFPQCGFSGQTVAALNAIGKPFAFVNIFEDEEIRQGLNQTRPPHTSPWSSIALTTLMKPAVLAPMK